MVLGASAWVWPTSLFSWGIPPRGVPFHCPGEPTLRTKRYHHWKPSDAQGSKRVTFGEPIHKIANFRVRGEGQRPRWRELPGLRVSTRQGAIWCAVAAQVGQGAAGSYPGASPEPLRP